jgi:hypothetical protein
LEEVPDLGAQKSSGSVGTKSDAVPVGDGVAQGDGGDVERPGRFKDGGE